MARPRGRELGNVQVNTPRFAGGGNMRNASRFALRRATTNFTRSTRNPRNRIAILAAAGALALFGAGGGIARSADVLLNSFETGGFDTAGVADVTTTPFQTTGVTDGSFSLGVSSTNTGFWTDAGHINVNPTDVTSHQVLKWDVTT